MFISYLENYRYLINCMISYSLCNFTHSENNMTTYIFNFLIVKVYKIKKNIKTSIKQH